MQKQLVRQLQVLGFAEKKLLLAVSGGVDSVVLVDLLVKSGYAVSIAHANFQLRGAESDRDEAFVIQLGTSLSVPVFTKRFGTNNYATAHGISVQMAARDLRYAWFRELLSQEGLDAIVTAHHLNDSLETTLLHLARGTGIQGLKGIPVTNDKVVRPMLIFSRSEIEGYARDNTLRWREDSSNLGDDYSRNLIRHHVIPRLKAINPALEITYRRTMERLHAAAELMDDELARLRQAAVLSKDGTVVIRKSALMHRKHPAGILWELVKEYGFNFPQCEGIVDAIALQSGKTFLSPEFELTVDRETLIIVANSRPWGSISIEEYQHEALLGPLQMFIHVVDPAPLPGDASVAHLDRKKLIFPLRWRLWEAGDAFHPLGMTHRKKISDFLIDSKVPGPHKDRVTVLESGGDVAWVVGYRIDDRFKITEATKSVVVFRMERVNS